MEQQRILIDFNQLDQVMQMGVRRASAFMKLGLRTAEDESISDISLPSAGPFTWHFFPVPTPPEIVRQMKFDFGHWIIGCALKELDQHCSVFCDQVVKALTLARFHGSQLTSEARKRVASFESETNVAKKLSIISSEFGVSSEGSKYMAGFSVARNALTHNLGRVGERHLRNGELKIAWRAVDLLFNGSVADESDFNVPRPTETDVSIKFVKRTKIFHLNEFVEFSQMELSEICWNYSSMSKEIVRGALANAANTLSTPPPAK
jgi:hypothetical protein